MANSVNMDKSAVQPYYNQDRLYRLCLEMKYDPDLRRLYQFKIDLIKNSMPALRASLGTKTFETFWPPKVQALLDHADWCIQTYIKSTYNTNPIND